MKRTSTSRHGTIIVCVLACLVIVTGLIAATVRNVLHSRRQVRLEHQLMQTELLCEAGVRRAAAQLKTSSDYRGETWSPKLDSVPWNEAAVEIRIERQADAAARRVEVVARVGSEPLGIPQMQRSHTFTVNEKGSDEPKNEEENASAPSSSEKT
ncbi:MAG: hypothetical protein ACTHOU_05525 [Aureliella sp.]